ncbi:MAG: VCBS repeat-containing protein, partial [Bdellovibrionales bacterium]|nr:VCBS repeat-containing protein [Bdellovibrionales bacterium]
TFAHSDSTSIGLLPLFMATGDLNNDGNLDVVASSQPTDTFTVSLGNGDGTFTASTSYATGVDPYGILLADFNSDGILDVTTANRTDDTLSFRLGRGDGTFDSEQVITAYNQAFDLTAGDFNGDGAIDLFGTSRNGGLINKFISRTSDGIAPIADFSLETMAEAREAVVMLQGKHELLLKQRGEIGASQARLDIARSVLQSQTQLFLSAESQIRDIDVALETSLLVREQILQRTAAQVLSYVNLQPQLVIELLR